MCPKCLQTWVQSPQSPQSPLSSMSFPPFSPSCCPTHCPKYYHHDLSSDLKTSLDPKFTCWYSLPGLSMSTTACQAHLRVTALEKQGKHFSPSRLPFFCQKQSVGILHLLIYLFITGGGKNPTCTREGEHLKWISQRFPSLPLTPPWENARLRWCECKILLKVNQHYRKGSHELLLMPTKQTWALGNINIIYMMIHICFLSICYKLQHPTQGIKQSTFFCSYAANVWVVRFF